jgi:hypothetical protein
VSIDHRVADQEICGVEPQKVTQASHFSARRDPSSTRPGTNERDYCGLRPTMVPVNDCSPPSHHRLPPGKNASDFPHAAIEDPLNRAITIEWSRRRRARGSVFVAGPADRRQRPAAGC